MDVLPLLFVSPKQIVGEGKQVIVSVQANGVAPEGSITVDYKFGGTADCADHNAIDGTLSLTDGFGEISFEVLDDGIIEGQESIVVTFSNPANSALASSSQTITVIEKNAAPRISLKVEQNGNIGTNLVNSSDIVTVTVEVFDPNANDAFTFDWHVDNRVVVSANPTHTFSFEPVDLEVGFYRASVEVVDMGGATTSESVLVQVLDDLVPDSNANRINDDEELFDETFVVQIAQNATIAQTEAHLQIRLGETALFAGRKGIAIRAEDILAFGGVDGGGVLAENNLSTGFTPTTGIYDFEVEGLSRR